MSSDNLYSENYKGYTIRIVQDELYGSFFDSQEVFTQFACWHRRYNLGNVDMTQEDFNDMCKENKGKMIKLPLYMYDHSGLSIHAGSRPYPYDDMWDSGQLGYVYCTYDMIRKEFNCKHVTKSIQQKAIALLLAEVDTYDSILRGEVYGYIIEDSGEQFVDSCSGFVGDYKYALQEAKSIVDYTIQERAKEENNLINRAMCFAGGL